MDLGASGQTSKLARSKELLEVDLGDMSSLQSNEMHIKEMIENAELAKGQVVVDDATNTDDAAKYKLVMVGRKVTAEEQESDRYLETVLDGSQHGITSEVFHESGDQYS